MRANSLQFIKKKTKQLVRYVEDTCVVAASHDILVILILNNYIKRTDKQSHNMTSEAWSVWREERGSRPTLRWTARGSPGGWGGPGSHFPRPGNGRGWCGRRACSCLGPLEPLCPSGAQTNWASVVVPAGFCFGGGGGMGVRGQDSHSGNESCAKSLEE